MVTIRTYTKEEAQKRYDSLPLEVKALLYSPQMHATIEELGKKHQLHIDQLGLLEVETGAVMLGFTEMQDFQTVLMESLQVDRTKADAVAQDVSERLFTKIRDAMKQSYEKRESAAEIPVPPPIKPAPPVSVPPSAPKPIEPHPADLMLSQKTTSAPPAPAAKPPVVPPAPQPYKADPYREPTE